MAMGRNIRVFHNPSVQPYRYIDIYNVCSYIVSIISTSCYLQRPDRAARPGHRPPATVPGHPRAQFHGGRGNQGI